MKLAEVVMLPKVVKRDETIGKGLERYTSSQTFWAALRQEAISQQQFEALPRRSGTDLTTAFTHDAELALAIGTVVIVVRMDVQGASDALIKRRLMSRMIKQG
ncbi:uncharacterized protein EAE97_012188 [Botrytis byssoidea]|uniref:Uncharacterized protein n=1 Tax=Botrytis byssoidea TaxID=139641 RepID=A0A9P5HRK5_9HELO|nr:uncharacterized protein EAE97_012188 [Botrytis byssoidea]KAF7915730.1 hypothetical protein EAE97_012188 [Botrytis byssoidea]